MCLDAEDKSCCAHLLARLDEFACEKHLVDHLDDLDKVEDEVHLADLAEITVHHLDENVNAEMRGQHGTPWWCRTC